MVYVCVYVYMSQFYRMFVCMYVCMYVRTVDESQPSKRYLSLEACTFDETVARMGQFADLSSITLTVQRLLPRKSVVTVIVGPEGEEVGNFTVNHIPIILFVLSLIYVLEELFIVCIYVCMYVH
jgi:hypothetical protein